MNKWVIISSRFNTNFSRPASPYNVVPYSRILRETEYQPLTIEKRCNYSEPQSHKSYLY